MSKPDLIGDLFGWVGTAIATYFYISPVVPFVKVVKEEISYKDSPGILLICSFMNCILWADYGLILDRLQVYLANGIGGFITLMWITIFLIFVAQKNCFFGFILNLLLIAAICGIAFVFYYIVDVEITGKVAMGFNILMYAAPGEKIFRVFKSGNYNLIPIFSSVGGLTCSLCWMMYGLYLMDYNMIIPNALGLFFAILQVFIYIIFYCKAKKEEDELTKDDDDAV